MVAAWDVVPNRRGTKGEEREGYTWFRGWRFALLAELLAICHPGACPRLAESLLFSQNRRWETPKSAVIDSIVGFIMGLWVGSDV
jgi:hypothetical protein